MPVAEPSPKWPCKQSSALDLVGVESNSTANTTAERPQETKAAEQKRCPNTKPPAQNRCRSLVWWRNHMKHPFPRIAYGARKILTVPATSTSAERVFSISRLLASQQRAALSPLTVDAHNNTYTIVFLNKNLQLLFGSECNVKVKKAAAALYKPASPSLAGSADD